MDIFLSLSHGGCVATKNMHKNDMIELCKFTIKIREYEENVKLRKENSYNLHKDCGGQRYGYFDILKTNISLKVELAVAHNRLSR